MRTGNVTVVDVTLRDGGKVNGHRWTLPEALRVVDACAAANVGEVEVGYYRPARHRVDGADRPAASCPPAYLAELRDRAGSAALSVMASRADLAPAGVAALSRQGVRSLAMPVRVGDAAALLPYVTAAAGAGLRLVAKLMRVRGVSDDRILRAAEVLGDVDVLYVADSYGALFPPGAGTLFGKLAATTGAALGLHAHDGQQLAFANALAALDAGVSCLDGSLCGLGVDGGNLRLESIVAYLRVHAGRDLRCTPLAEAAVDLLAARLPGDPAAMIEDLLLGVLDLEPGAPVLAVDDRLGVLCALADASPAAARGQPG